MSNSKGKVAVIGLGNIGKVVAANLVKGKREVIVASRKLEDARALASQLGQRASAVDVAAAIKGADILILSTWFSSIQEFLKQYASELQGKIIIDPSNPITPDGNNGFKKIIGAQESAGQIIRSLLLKGAKLVKAFGTLSAASLEGAAHKWPNASVLFYATDEKARLFINNQKYANFVVEKMKGSTTTGAVALWVDIGTIGYFKDLKVTKR